MIENIIQDVAHTLCTIPAAITAPSIHRITVDMEWEKGRLLVGMENQGLALQVHVEMIADYGSLRPATNYQVDLTDIPDSVCVHQVSSRPFQPYLWNLPDNG
jgi:hypothetical protein